MKIKLSNQFGFTMLEIIIAVSILAAMAMTTTQITDSVLKTNDDVLARNELRHGMVTAISKMQDDLRMAFLVDKKYYGTDDFYKTSFTGTLTNLNFSTMSNVHYVKNKKDTDQVQVGYGVNANDHGYSSLTRRQTDYLTDKTESAGINFVLLDDVKDLRFSYYDSNKKTWEDEWDTESISSAGRLPSMVKIKLTVVGAPLSEDSEERDEFEYEIAVPIELYTTKLGS